MRNPNPTPFTINDAFKTIAPGVIKTDRYGAASAELKAGGMYRDESTTGNNGYEVTSVTK